MQFTQTEFGIFFLVVFTAAWLCRDRRHRNLILLAASYYFYAHWDYRFCGLLVLSTAVDYFVALGMQRTDSAIRRRLLLSASLVINLGMLGLFKYFNFFIESAQAVLNPLGWNTSTLDLVLPVGISFFTFQTLSYTIDVYRGKLTPTRSLLDFSLFVAFFPQLVAGPIVRASELLPQLSSTPSWSSRRCYAGFQMVLRGMVKKVLIADRLGEMVDVVFAGPDLYSGATIWLAVLGYAGQIYYDFSGYTDMASGVAKMLGYRFPVNFRHPYMSTSPSEFWRRWHITLSRWLRDYLYIPLGGNRRGKARTQFNLIVTMLLGGLWHGAAWTYIAWGLIHGIALAVTRPFRRFTSSVGRKLIAWAGTMSVVLFGWIFFRAETFADAATIMQRMATLADGIVWLPPLAILALTCMVAEHVAWTTRLRIAMRLPAHRWYSPIVTTIALWCLLLYAPRGFAPFVYFQF